MRTLVRRLELKVPPDAAFRVCLRLVTDADASRGVIERRCRPHPPRKGSEILTVVRDSKGQRRLRARIVEFDPPRLLTTATEDDGPAVRTALLVEHVGTGSAITLSSEATTALGASLQVVGMVDRALLARAQRRAAKATLRRLREFAAELEAGADSHGAGAGHHPEQPE